MRGRDVSCRVWERQHRGRVLDRYRWVSQGFRVRGSIGEGNGFGREKLESLDAKSPNPLKPFQPFSRPASPYIKSLYIVVAVIEQ